MFERDERIWRALDEEEQEEEEREEEQQEEVLLSFGENEVKLKKYRSVTVNTAK